MTIELGVWMLVPLIWVILTLGRRLRTVHHVKDALTSATVGALFMIAVRFFP